VVNLSNAVFAHDLYQALAVQDIEFLKLPNDAVMRLSNVGSNHITDPIRIAQGLCKYRSDLTIGTNDEDFIFLRSHEKELEMKGWKKWFSRPSVKKAKFTTAKLGFFCYFAV
jgi:hypothetical protein